MIYASEAIYTIWTAAAVKAERGPVDWTEPFLLHVADLECDEDHSVRISSLENLRHFIEYLPPARIVIRSAPGEDVAHLEQLRSLQGPAQAGRTLH